MLYMKDHHHLTFGHDWQGDDWMPKISYWHHQGWIRPFRSLSWPEVWEAPGETVTCGLFRMWVFEERWIFTCSQRDMVQSVSVQLNWALDAFLTAVKGLKCCFFFPAERPTGSHVAGAPSWSRLISGIPSSAAVCPVWGQRVGPVAGSQDALPSPPSPYPALWPRSSCPRPVLT